MDIEKVKVDNRILILKGSINKDSANEIIMQLLYLDSRNHNDIYLYINSSGGDVMQGLAIIDTMNYIKSKVITIVIGVAYSMAAIILSSGSKRYALPHSEIMIHEPSMNTGGKASEIVISSKRIDDMRLILAKIIKRKSSKSLNQIIKDMNKDYFLTSKDAESYGLIDKVISKNFKSI